MQHNRPLSVLMVVMLINAISYGVLIPLLYPYAARFGLSGVGLGLLFASFSIFQFLATPIIGRLSDRFGRKPLLLGSLLGTAGSLALFALAQSVPMLFLARILDGITGGNNAVAQAVITDLYPPEKRAEQFGLLGAAFGLGFLLGPALGGLLSAYSLTAPFWVAAVMAGMGTLFGAVALPETRVTHTSAAPERSLYNLTQLWQSPQHPATGSILLVTLLFALAQNTFVIGFQISTVDVFQLSARAIGIIFSLYGMVTMIMQTVGLRLALRRFSADHLLRFGFILSAVVLFGMSLSTSFAVFMGFLLVFMWTPPPLPLLSSLLSERVNADAQGEMLGLNQSTMSLGQILGPLIAGGVSLVNAPAVFAVAGLFHLGAVLKNSQTSRDAC